jgi:hypothetical protein
VVEAQPQPDAFQYRRGARATLCSGHAPTEQREFDVLQNGQGGDQIEFLKHNADAVAPQPRPALL